MSYPHSANPFRLALRSLLCTLCGISGAHAASLSLTPTEDYQLRMHSTPSNSSLPSMQISAAVPANNFSFAYLKFDVTSLTSGIPKTLSLSPTGTQGADLRLVVLSASIPDTDGTANGDFRDIPANAADNHNARRTWFDQHVATQSLVTLFVIPDTNTVTMDVTAAVDAWINGSVPNYGFALFTTVADAKAGNNSNGIFSANMSNDLLPGGEALRPTLTQVPEPGAVPFVLLGAAAFWGRRRRTKAQA